MGLTERLARASAQAPWRVVAGWAAAVVVAIAAIAVLLPSALTTDAVLSDTESQRADAIIAEGFPPRALDRVDEAVVVRAAAGADPLAAAAAVAADIEATGATAAVGDPVPSRDGDAALVTVVMDERRGDPEETIEDVVAAVEAARRPGLEVAITGEFTADRDFLELSNQDLQEGELQFGLPAAMVVLLLVFGAVVAGLVPVLLAMVSIVVALALTAVIGQAYELSFFVVNMLTGMGLALGIDYALFVVSRMREERARGAETLEAIAAAGRTSSRAVLFSGLAFVLALTGMVLVPDPILRSLGAGAILVGAVAVVAALTLLPAVLALLGDRIEALRLPWIGRAGSEGAFWGRIVRAVLRRPALSLVLSVGVLLAAAAPVLDLRTGFAGISTLPDRFVSKQGFDLYTEEFGGGDTDPALVAVRAGDADPAALAAAVDRLGDLLADDPAFGPSEVTAGRAGVTLVRAPVLGDPASTAAVDGIERLRDRHVPEAFAGTGAEVAVGGDTAENADYFAMVETWLPIVFAFVLTLSAVLLTIAFRSIVVALKAVALNLLSVGAAYGLLVLVFQKGYGADLLGFRQVETVEAWVPLFLFSVLFGLSMDYHVFLLSRVRERYLETRSTAEAVEWAVSSTARLITGAAVIIIAVFVGFARGDLVMFQQMGFGVAVSLLIDATLIRSVVVPAAMALLGDWNWYLPRWLGWLPDVSVEASARRR